MKEPFLKKIDSRFSLCEWDIGEFATLKAGGMNFNIRRYNARGLGVVSVMSATGMMGMMKMTTLIINPLYRDAPLYSYDSISALGRRTEIFELYDTQLGVYNGAELMKVKKSAANLPGHNTGEHWYDSVKMPESFALRGGRRYSKDFDRVQQESISAFIALATKAPECDPNEKRERASSYVEGLLKHGGPSTDVFRKSIGDEKTADLFRRVLFGTKDLFDTQAR